MRAMEYEKPKLEWSLFDCTDIITTSTITGEISGDGNEFEFGDEFGQ